MDPELYSYPCYWYYTRFQVDMLISAACNGRICSNACTFCLTVLFNVWCDLTLAMFGIVVRQLDIYFTRIPSATVKRNLTLNNGLSRDSLWL